MTPSQRDPLNDLFDAYAATTAAQTAPPTTGQLRRRMHRRRSTRVAAAGVAAAVLVAPAGWALQWAGAAGDTAGAGDGRGTEAVCDTPIDESPSQEASASPTRDDNDTTPGDETEAWPSHMETPTSDPGDIEYDGESTPNEVATVAPSDSASEEPSPGDEPSCEAPTGAETATGEETEPSEGSESPSHVDTPGTDPTPTDEATGEEGSPSHEEPTGEEGSPSHEGPTGEDPSPTDGAGEETPGYESPTG
jgi:hypothetical protein